MSTIISSHLNHLISDTTDGCERCSETLLPEVQAHINLAHEALSLSCPLCRRGAPQEWAEAFIADVQAEFQASVDAFAMTPEEYHSELSEYVSAVQTGMLKRGSEVASLGEETMKSEESKAAQLVAAAEAVLSKSDEQIDAEAVAVVEEIANEAKGEADFRSEFKNLFADTGEIESLALPAGQYPVRIVGCSHRLSSQGRRPQLVVTAEVGKGEFAGSLVTKYITLGTTPNAKQFFAGQLRVMGVDQDSPATSWREIAREIATQGLPLWAEVGPQTIWQGKARTNVKWFNPLQQVASQSASVVSASDLTPEGGE